MLTELPENYKAVIAASTMVFSVVPMNIAAGPIGLGELYRSPGLRSTIFFPSFAVYFMALFAVMDWGARNDISLFLLSILPAAFLLAELIIAGIHRLTGWGADEIDHPDKPDRIVRLLSVMAFIYALAITLADQSPTLSGQLDALNSIAEPYLFVISIAALALAALGIFGSLSLATHLDLDPDDDDFIFRAWWFQILWSAMMGLAAAAFYTILASIIGIGYAEHLIIIPLAIGVASAVFVFVSWGIDHRFKPIPARPPRRTR